MNEEITVAEIDAAVLAVCSMLISEADTFNRLDAATGDGDMGSTLAAVARTILSESGEPSVDIGSAFQRVAQAIAKTSGSSLSAIAMTIAMSLARSTQSRATIGVDDFVLALGAALELARERSGASFGDKTILDGIKFIVDGARAARSSISLAAKALEAIDHCLVAFRPRPIRVGRARLSLEGGVGVDDPGMVALAKVIKAATTTSPVS